MKIIAIINLKGGVGKTTTTLALAHLLAEKEGKRVLIVDNDKQGNLTTNHGCYDGERKGGTAQMLETGKTSEILETKYQNLYIMTNNLWMEFAENKVMKEGGKLHLKYKKALRQIDERYDYCIIDNPPDLGVGVANALTAADKVIIPANLDLWSLYGMDVLLEQIEDFRAANEKRKKGDEKILITNVEKNKVSEAAEEWLRQRYKNMVFQTKIRHSKAVKESTVYKKPVTEYSIRSGAAQDYKKLLKEIGEEKWDK